MQGPGAAPASLEAWRLVRQMLDDLTATVVEDAESELELLEGLRVLGRAAALCSELALDIDVAARWFFSMNTQTRMIGGPAPDGEYYLAMVDGERRYRVRGRRGTTAYLGFQVLAGIGSTPRRMGAYVSDTDLDIGPDGTFSFVLATEEPSVDELGGGPMGPLARGLLEHRRPGVHRGPSARAGGRSGDRAARSTRAATAPNRCHIGRGNSPLWRGPLQS